MGNISYSVILFFNCSFSVSLLNLEPVASFGTSVKTLGVHLNDLGSSRTRNCSEVIEYLDQGNFDLNNGKPHGDAVPWTLSKPKVGVRRPIGFALWAEVIGV